VYKCQVCQRKYVPEPKASGHGVETRQQAIRLVLDGYSGYGLLYQRWATTI